MNLKENLNHSCAHLLAMAVYKKYPKVKFGIGPAIDEGFYYDFDFEKPITDDDLKKIQQTMKKKIDEDIKFEKETWPIKKAKRYFKDNNQDYKLELIEDLAQEGEDEVSVYESGEFVDLCRGPHIKSTGRINKKGFKLLRQSGAYWKGDESNSQLTRIYGVCFEKEKDLKQYLQNREKAIENDHKKIGKELDLFSFQPSAPGMVFWQPKGYHIYQTLIDWWREQQKRYDYEEVKAPSMMKVDLWKKSGHFDHYKESMFFAGEEDQYALRPMDCPGEILIYKSKLKSYRDLPVRYCEIGRIFRNEQSGELNGLLRAQEFTQDDAHVFVTLEQVQSEIETIIKMVKEAYEMFDLDYRMVLSTRPEDYAGKKKDWQRAEKALKKAIKVFGNELEIEKGEGAFYGPKIDFMVKDSLGREWQLATIQLDFYMPEKFDINYIDKKGEKKHPAIIHRVIFGSIERFIGVMLEHLEGKLPFWLAPVQTKILPISDEFNQYGEKVKGMLREKGVKRVVVDRSQESLSKKIREGEKEKVPYLLVVGEKEEKSGKIAVRDREKGDLGPKSIKNFINLTK